MGIRPLVNKGSNIDYIKQRLCKKGKEDTHEEGIHTEYAHVQDRDICGKETTRRRGRRYTEKGYIRK